MIRPALLVLSLALSGATQAPLPLSGAPQASLPPAGEVPPATPAELAVVREITKIRMFPREYAKYLRALGTHFEGTLWRLREHVPIRTQEGRPAVIEAAEFLETVEPIPGVVRPVHGLHAAAREHVLAQGPGGLMGHRGQDGSDPGDRVERHGTFTNLVGEVINYGDETPRMTVIQLVIDDGVPGRGHRKTLFNPALREAGAAIGFHRGYGSMTVVDLVDAFTPPPVTP